MTGGRYGFHRDELATLDDARHLAWGYVAYPPVTPFFGRLSLNLFGTSLTGFRFFAAVSTSFAVVLTGLMARELGGKTGAQALAASAAIPFALGAGSLMQYVSFDYLAWVACSYFFILLCKSRDPRWWLAIGGCIGFGMLTKYSMLVCALAIAAGVLFTDLRTDLRSKWLWLGVAVSLLIFLPNLIWQIQNDFVSLDFSGTSMNETCDWPNEKFPAGSTGTHAIHIASGDPWFGFLLWIRKGTSFSRGRIFVRNSAYYFLLCKRSRLLSRSGLSGVVCWRCRFWS